MVTSSNLANAAAAYEGFATGNMEPLFSSLAPDVMWTNHSHSDSPFMGVYEGPVGVQQFFGHMPEIELEQHDVLSMIEKEDTVVVLIQMKRTIKATGKKAAGQVVHVLKYQDSKLKKMDIYEPLMN